MSDPQFSAMEVKPANKRGSARLAAVQAIYQMDLSSTPVSEIVKEYENLRIGQEIDGDTYLKADLGWFRGVVAGVVEFQTKLDPMINNALPTDWPLSRIDTLLRAIMRSATFELLKRKDVPAKVVIHEYLDVANAFYNEDEPRLVNGVLNHLARELRKDEFTQE